MIDLLLAMMLSNKTEVVEEIKSEPEAVEIKQQYPCDNCVYITNSESVLDNSYNSQSNYIYLTNVIIKGQVTKFLTLSGRANTQSLDRNVANTGAPSPNGEYTISSLTNGLHSETGGVFIPYEPIFQTERSALGFHIDPSWGLSNGEDGTIGCHAFFSEEQFTNFLTLIQDNNINKLIIDYEKI